MTEKKKKAAVIVLITISAIGLLWSAAISFPQIQKTLLKLAEENIIHRKLKSYEPWMNVLSSLAKGFIFIILTADFFVLTKKGRDLILDILNGIRTIFPDINFKSLVKPVVIMFFVYCLAYLTIFRANYSYADDLARAATGYRRWIGWSRYIAECLSILIHADYILTDISPLPQLIAVLILAVSSVLLVYILHDKKISCLALIASLPIGLSPYFLENISYKFDAPYFALSIAASILPFLFVQIIPVFVFTSIVCLLIMCTTYQASSGIYIMLTLFFCFKEWNAKQKTNKEIFGFAGIAALSYGLTLLLFRFTLMVSNSGYGISTSVLKPQDMAAGILNNAGRYLMNINADFNVTWKVLLLFIIILFIIQNSMRSNRKWFGASIVSTAVLILGFIFSYGVFMVLENPAFYPRAIFGFGIFIALVSISTASFKAKTAAFCIILLNWCLFVFSFSYGNALADQKRYEEFRAELVMQDLNELFPDRSRELLIRRANSIGHGPITENIGKNNPVIRKLVPSFWGGGDYLANYFNWETLKGTDDPFNNELPVILTNHYHTIRSDGKYVMVEFHN
jgi:hypothetical protein